MKHLFVVFGPSGCGKSTMSEYIARKKSYMFLEGDQYHPEANVAKMALGQPLDDYDRAGWLSDLSNAAVAYLNSGSPVVIVACSALRVAYRDVFRVAYRDVFRLAVSSSNDLVADSDSTIQMHFIYLQMNEKMALGLVDERARKHGHFMPPVLVRSQFETLEEPDEYELGNDCVTVDSSQSTRKVKESAYAVVKHYVKHG